MLKTTFVLAAMMAGAAAMADGPAASPAQGDAQGARDWCQSSNYSNNRETHAEVRELTTAASGATLSVDASPNGGISVTGQTRADIQVLACVTATADTAAEAKALAQRVEVVAMPDRISASGPDNLERPQSWHVSYRVAVPTRTPLSLKTANGGISLSDLHGQIEFQTVNGGVKLARVGGSVRGRTSNGGVDVDLDGSTWDGEGLDVETQNGGVKMAIPANYSARLQAGTHNGGFNIDFPVQVERRQRNIDTQLGSGGPLLKVQTSNGGVTIRKK